MKDMNRRNDLRPSNVLAYEPYFTETCRQLINDNEVYVRLPLRYVTQDLPESAKTIES